MLQHNATVGIYLLDRIVEVSYRPVACISAPRLYYPSDELHSMPCRLYVELFRMYTLMQNFLHLPTKLTSEFQDILLLLRPQEHIIHEPDINHSTRFTEGHCPLIDVRHYEIGKVLRCDVPNGKTNMLQCIHKALPRIQPQTQPLISTELAVILWTVHHDHLNEPQKNLDVSIRMSGYNPFLICEDECLKQRPGDILVDGHEE